MDAGDLLRRLDLSTAERRREFDDREAGLSAFALPGQVWVLVLAGMAKGLGWVVATGVKHTAVT